MKTKLDEYIYLGGCGDNLVAEYVTISNPASENAGLHAMVRVQECCRQHGGRSLQQFRL